MVYIGTTAEDGSAVYFDVRSIERCTDGIRVTGTIGDGQYEGEVLVELGSSSEVTFVDAWLGGLGYREFITRFDREVLQQDLLDSLRSIPLLGLRRVLPHGHQGLRGAGYADDNGPLWRGVA
jgi:hypothetical protein